MHPLTFQLRLDLVCLLPFIPLNSQNIGLATHLTVFHVALSPSSGLVYRGFVPLPATCTLKTGIAGHTDLSAFTVSSLSEAGRVRLALLRQTKRELHLFRRMIYILVRCAA